MAVLTPTIVNQQFYTGASGPSNSYFGPGFAGISTGTLLLALMMPNRASAPYKSAAEASDAWYALPQASLGDDVGSWSTANIGSTLPSLSAGRNATIPVWKISDGDEDATRGLIGQYGYTSFGEDPRFYGLVELTGFKEDVPVRMLSTWRVATTVAAVLPSAAPGTVEPNSLEILCGLRYTGTSAGAWDVGTFLAFGNSTLDSDASFRIHTRVANADGSLDAATWTGSGNLRATRVVVQGVEPPDPVFFEADVSAQATADARMRNISQERRNADQAIDRRQHIWVSDLNGVRKVSLR